MGTLCKISIIQFPKSWMSKNRTNIDATCVPFNQGRGYGEGASCFCDRGSILSGREHKTNVVNDSCDNYDSQGIIPGPP